MNVGDARSSGNWAELEKTYGINLDPQRLMNEPAVLEGSFWEGKVLLSLVHFDTPEDRNGQTMLRNIWAYLAPQAMSERTVLEMSGPQGHFLRMNAELTE